MAVDMCKRTSGQVSNRQVGSVLVEMVGSEQDGNRQIGNVYVDRSAVACRQSGSIRVGMSAVDWSAVNIYKRTCEEVGSEQSGSV